MNQKKVVSTLLNKLGLVCKISKSFSASNKKVLGNLYTWGAYPSGTGIDVNSHQENLPVRLSVFNSNVAKVSMGPLHSAVITGDGNLYTFGLNNHGALGGDRVNEYEPDQVDFFRSHRLKVVDVSCGERHTVAVTDNGEVWSWGYGGKSGLLSFLSEDIGALGLGSLNSTNSPTSIEALRGVARAQAVSSGLQFVTLLNEKKEVFNWGTGDRGNFGNGSLSNLVLPTLNENFKILREKLHLDVVKIKSCGWHTVVLLSDGKLYSMGENLEGQLGTRENLGHTNDAHLDIPTPVFSKHLPSSRIVDFDIGSNTLVFLTESNEVFWAGLGIAFKPLRLNVPKNKKIKLIAAGKDSVVAVTDTNELFSRNPFLNPSSFDQNLQVDYARNEVFEGGEILEIGGGYSNHYAIVKN